MPKVKVIIELTVKADSNSKDDVQKAVYSTVAELLEAEELEFHLNDEDDDDYDDLGDLGVGQKD